MKMQINQISNLTNNYYNAVYSVKNPVHRTVNNYQSMDTFTFKGNVQTIEKRLLEKYGMYCSFTDNEFVAESVETVAQIFAELFGRNSVPSYVKFKSFKKLLPSMKTDDVLGLWRRESCGDVVYFNSDNDLYNAKSKMAFNERIEKIMGTLASGHYLAPFVHEFAHAAHYAHLRKVGNDDMMEKFLSIKIPNALGQVLAVFKTGLYSLNNMSEYMAERITKDVCDNLNENNEYTSNSLKVKYDDMYSRNWRYRYTCPQSYLDYFAQQVWNGDMSDRLDSDTIIEYYLNEKNMANLSQEERHKLLDEMFKDLHEGQVHPIAQKIADLYRTDENPSLIERIGNEISHTAENIGRKVTRYLDSKNKFKT